MEKIDLKVKIENPCGEKEYDILINNIKFQKMAFLYNAINDGWTIKKKQDSYVFLKRHEGKREIFSDNYLLDFLTKNCDMNTLLQ
jgi:hypothetical protein